MMIARKKYPLVALVAVLAVMASVVFLPARPSVACEPLDPIPVVVGTTTFEIPAVLLPALRSKDGSEIKRESQSRSGRKVLSKAGSSLRWWFCPNESGKPFELSGFTLDGRWIADAVEQGELEFRYLSAISDIVVSEGQVAPHKPDAASDIPFFSGVFHANCGVPSTLPKTGEHEVTGTQCLVSSVKSSTDTKIRLDFWIYESPSRPTRNAPEVWPALAHETEQLIRSMRMPGA